MATPESFGDMLRRCLAARGLSQYEFAELVGVSQSYVAQVLRDAAPLAVDRIPAWCRTLGLHADDSRAFRLAALLARCPGEVREHVAALEARLARHEAR